MKPQSSLPAEWLLGPCCLLDLLTLRENDAASLIRSIVPGSLTWDSSQSPLQRLPDQRQPGSSPGLNAGV